MQKVLVQTVAALSLLPGAVWAQAPSDTERYYGWGPHMMGWGGGYAMIFGPLFMVLFLAVLVALAIVLARWLGGLWPGTYPPHQLPPARTPLDILKERFARGEIDKAEFEDRRRVLGE
ncbi:putative membrane protein [Bradyrhizobium sp. cf659]|nr:putative membrane protein [Bradyrhizobium sp. cf659]